MEKKKPILWFDMDGTMTEYDYAMYHAEDGKTPVFLKRNAHCFKNLKPNQNVLTAFNTLYQESRKQKEFYTRVLTGIPVGILQAEHTIDKFKWCEWYIKDFHQEDFFCTSVAKHSATASDLWKLTKKDILIDDYNPNLYHWKEHGGTAIKCVNQINSINPDFDYINILWSPVRIVRAMHYFIQQVNT